MSHTQAWQQQLAADPGAALPVGLWSGLLLIDVVLWSRWLSGAMAIPLPAPIAWASTGAITAVAVTALVLWRESDHPWFPRSVWLPEGLTLALPFLWGWVVGYGASPFALGGLFALWGMLLVSVGLVHFWVPGEQSACELASDHRGFIGQPATDNSQPTTNWQKRFTLPEGDLIEGGAHVDFAPGQKETVIHLAFCPPLSSVPEIHGEDALGGDLEVRAEAVHTFGARLSVRRRSGIESAETREISYAAVPCSGQDAAA